VSKRSKELTDKCLRDGPTLYCLGHVTGYAHVTQRRVTELVFMRLTLIPRQKGFLLRVEVPEVSTEFQTFGTFQGKDTNEPYINVLVLSYGSIQHD